MRLAKKTTLNMFLLLLILLISFNIRPAYASDSEPEVNIYFFWGEGCPHCEAARPILQNFADQDPRVGFYDFEIYNSRENQNLFLLFGEAYGFEPRYVPTIFIADQYWEGFSDDYAAEMEAYLNTCLANGCPDPGAEVLANQVLSEPTATPVPELTPTPTQADNQSKIDHKTPSSVTKTPESTPTPTLTPVGAGSRTSIKLPLIGTIDLSGQSLFFSTLIISFVDGFNPCSLWVLSILLSITLQSGSRKKVFIVGGVFLLVTATLYGLFIAGVFSVLRVFSFMGWIQVVVALIALVFALINIKDYFWFQQGISLTISKDKKPGIYKRMRGVLEKSDSIWRMIGATIVFAAGIALVELSCTAGFPVIWSNLLASQQVKPLTFVLLLLVYILIYLLDELGIFLVAVFTLRSSKLEEKHGRVLKLIGGMLMLTLAVVMLINPNLMNELVNTLIIFGIALGLTGLVLLLHRVILPKFNINIGSEKS